MITKEHGLMGSFYSEVKSGKSGTVKRTYGKLPDGMVSQSRFSRKSESIIDPPIRNMVTDHGLNSLGTSTWNNKFIFLGKGTQDFLPSSTSLSVHHIPNGPPTRSTTISNNGGLDGNWVWRATSRSVYSIGELNGIFTELGLVDSGDLAPGNSSFYQTMPFSALSLIKDSEGVQGSIEVLSDEELTLHHTIEVLPPAPQFTDTTMMFNGEPVNVRIEARRSPGSINIRNSKLHPAIYQITNASLGHLAYPVFKPFAYEDQSLELKSYATLAQGTVDYEFYALSLTGGADYLITFLDGPLFKGKDEIMNFGTPDQPFFKTSWGRV